MRRSLRAAGFPWVRVSPPCLPSCSSRYRCLPYHSCSRDSPWPTPVANPSATPGSSRSCCCHSAAIALVVLAWVHFVERRSLSHARPRRLAVGQECVSSAGSSERCRDLARQSWLSIFLDGRIPFATGFAPAFRFTRRRCCRSLPCWHVSWSRPAPRRSCFAAGCSPRSIAKPNPSRRGPASRAPSSHSCTMARHQHWLMTLNMVLYSAFACCLAHPRQSHLGCDGLAHGLELAAGDRVRVARHWRWTCVCRRWLASMSPSRPFDPSDRWCRRSRRQRSSAASSSFLGIALPVLAHLLVTARCSINMPGVPAWA